MKYFKNAFTKKEPSGTKAPEPINMKEFIKEHKIWLHPVATIVSSSIIASAVGVGLYFSPMRYASRNIFNTVCISIALATALAAVIAPASNILLKFLTLSDDKKKKAGTIISKNHNELAEMGKSISFISALVLSYITLSNINIPHSIFSTDMGKFIGAVGIAMVFIPIGEFITRALMFPLAKEAGVVKGEFKSYLLLDNIREPLITSVTALAAAIVTISSYAIFQKTSAHLTHTILENDFAKFIGAATLGIAFSIIAYNIIKPIMDEQAKNESRKHFMSI